MRISPAAAIRELARRGLIKPAWPRWTVAHEPFAKQRAFLALDCEEALYGGAAGGGKSDAILQDALSHVHVPGYGALILRRTYQELVKKGALIDRAHEWLGGSAAKWNGEKHRWTFPSGAIIEFGYFDQWQHRTQYQSAQWERIYFDELTHFPEDHYAFMFTRLRRAAGFLVPTAMRSATNPGGIGHHWVKRRFLDEPGPGVAFVPATFRENPYVDQADYEAKLARAPEIVRRQMLGEWIQDGMGNVYGGFVRERNTFDADPGEFVRRAKLTRFVLALDFGITDPHAIAVLGWAEHSRTVYVLESWKRSEMFADDLADEIVALGKRYTFERIIGDLGGLGKAVGHELAGRRGIPVEPADKVNKLGYISLMNGAFERGEIMVNKSTARPLVDELETLPWDETGRKEASGMPNHCADAALYGWRACLAYLEHPEPVKPKPGTPEHNAAIEAEIEQELDRQRDEDPWEARGL